MFDQDDTGVISGVLVVLGDDLGGREVTDSEKEAITALCAAGALVGAILAGVTSDKYGRRPAIWFSSILFVSTTECMSDLITTQSLTRLSDHRRNHSSNSL